MTNYLLSGTVAGPSGFLNGAGVYAYKASLFASAPTAGQAAPTGLTLGTDYFGPATTGTQWGGPGQWELTVTAAVNYYIGVQYPIGSTTAKWYWSFDDSLTQIKGDTGTQGPQGNQGYQGSTGPQGTQGLTGAQGNQGTQGFQGLTGTQGTQGYQGTTGSQGATGTQGAQGYQGLTGSQGTQGTTGATGSQGNQGYQGNQGTQGYQGNQGFQGTTGSTGAQGSTGSQGSTGATGAQGTQGVQGNQGYQGPTGSQGTQGFQGNQGYQGYQGFQGNQGTQGYQGNQGNSGDLYQTTSTTSLTIATGTQTFTVATGLSYSTGQAIVIAHDVSNTMIGIVSSYNTGTGVLVALINGISGSGTYTSWTVNLYGASGPQGTQGYQGATGAQGNQGYQGTTGTQGAQGYQGSTGTQGATGTQGSQGNQGFQGATGSTGTQGFQGTQGSTGPQGTQGYQGTTGAQGNQGFQGTQGSVSGPTFSGEVTGTDFKVTGLTGATAATRYVGGTTNGAPTSGTFAVGDFIVDQTATIWVCLVAGTPGTWWPLIEAHMVSRSATATATANEVTIFTGSTASQTISAIGSPVDGATWTIINRSSVPVTAGFGSSSMLPLGSTSSVTSLVVPVNGAYSFINYAAGQWYMTASNNLANSAGTLSVTNGGTGTSTAPAVGSIPLGSSTSAYTPLAIGTNGQLLTSNGTTATWATASFAPTASPTFTGTITETGTTIVTQAAGAFSNDDDQTMTIMGAWL